MRRHGATVTATVPLARAVAPAASLSECALRLSLRVRACTGSLTRSLPVRRSAPRRRRRARFQTELPSRSFHDSDPGDSEDHRLRVQGALHRDHASHWHPWCHRRARSFTGSRTAPASASTGSFGLVTVVSDMGSRLLSILGTSSIGTVPGQHDIASKTMLAQVRTRMSLRLPRYLHTRVALSLALRPGHSMACEHHDGIMMLTALPLAK